MGNSQKFVSPIDPIADVAIDMLSIGILIVRKNRYTIHQNSGTT